jgi:O-antigen ligase
VGIGNFHHKSFQELGTHNAYTQVAAETGILAMIAYIIFLVHPLRRLRLIERELFERNEISRFYYLAIGLQASLVGYMVASFFAAVAYQWYIYYLVGYAIALRRIYYLKESQRIPTVIPVRPTSA